MTNKKIIHYFHNKDTDIYKKDDTPQLRMCYTSWKIFCPDYEIKHWHDKMPEFQEMLKKSRFLRECYRLKIWAYVSDYVRLYALYNHGGIYLDTDVQLIKNPDRFLEDDFFISLLGHSDNKAWFVEPAVMGAVKGLPLLKKLMEYYESEEIFKLEQLMAPVVFNTVFAKEKILNKAEIFKNTFNKFEEYKNQETYELNNLKLYPMSYFSPFWEQFEDKAILGNTYAIHWNQSSWWFSPKSQLANYELHKVINANGPKKLYRQWRVFKQKIINFCYSLFRL